MPIEPTTGGAPAPDPHRPGEAKSRKAEQLPSDGKRLADENTPPQPTTKLGFFARRRRNSKISHIISNFQQALPDLSKLAAQHLEEDLKNGPFTTEWLDSLATYLSTDKEAIDSPRYRALIGGGILEAYPMLKGTLETVYERREEQASKLVASICDLMPGRIPLEVKESAQELFMRIPIALIHEIVEFTALSSPEEQATKKTDILTRSEDVLEHQHLPKLLEEITFAHFGHNTQCIDYARDPTSVRSKPFLHTINNLPGALEFEVRPGRVLLTHPITKETRSFEVDHDQTPEDKLAFRAMVQSVNLSTVPDLAGKTSTQIIKMRCLYTFEDPAGQRHLMITPPGYYGEGVHTILYPADTIDTVRDVIIDGEGSFTAQSFDPLKSEFETITISTEERSTEYGERFLDVTFTLDDQEYITHYPMQADETREDVARRIADDHTLERDILLAKAEFL